MPRSIVPLTDTKVKKSKPKEKDYKLFDGGGLYLLVTKSGGRYWHLKYRFKGKEGRIGLGPYPEISLADARTKKIDMKRLIEQGIDPAIQKKEHKQAMDPNVETFELVAREWYAKFKSQWSDNHAKLIEGRLTSDLFPWIGARPINEIKAPELLAVLRRIEGRGAIYSAHRVKVIAGQVFRYGVATGRVEHDVSWDLKGAIPPPLTKHHAAITEPVEVAKLLRAIDAYQGSFVVQCALKFAPLVFVRPGELRHAEWSEINFDENLWIIPARKMKMKQDHVVPLSSQAIQILQDIRSLTGEYRYIFPSGRSSHRPMSENAILAALRYMGYDKDTMTGHGFRAMARTILDEVLQIRPDYIEHQLAHAVRDPNGRAYNRTTYLPERKEMMQHWADYLDGIKQGAHVLPMRKQKEQ